MKKLMITVAMVLLMAVPASAKYPGEDRYEGEERYIYTDIYLYCLRETFVRQKELGIIDPYFAEFTAEEAVLFGIAAQASKNEWQHADALIAKVTALVRGMDEEQRDMMYGVIRKGCVNPPPKR